MINTAKKVMDEVAIFLIPLALWKPKTKRMIPLLLSKTVNWSYEIPPRAKPVNFNCQGCNNHELYPVKIYRTGPLVGEQKVMSNSLDPNDRHFHMRAFICPNCGKIYLPSTI